MPAFRYKALAQSGAIDEGTVTAKDMAAVQRQLRAQKLTPLSVNPTSGGALVAQAEPRDNMPLPDAETAKALLGKVSSGTRTKKNKKRCFRGPFFQVRPWTWPCNMIHGKSSFSYWNKIFS